MFLKVFRIGINLGLLSFILAEGQARGIKPEVRERLIKKLQKVYSSLPAKSQGRVPITLRLADLLSEKARYQAMMELQKGCLKCTAGEPERVQALKYYQEALPQLSKEQRWKTLGQIGHLYELLGRPNQAVSYYQSVLKASPSRRIKVETALSLGELYYKQHFYESALRQYDFVLSVQNKEGIRGRALAAYRKAWALFNLGRFSSAISALTKIIKTPELQVRGARDPKAIKEYRMEVSRDLATFMAKSKMGLKGAKSLYALSPDGAKLENLAALASDLERIDEFPKALAIYHFILQKGPKDQYKKLDFNFKISQLEKRLNRPQKAVLAYGESLKLWSQVRENCSKEECAKWPVRLRKFVLDWHREKESQTSPSAPLLESYRAYLKAVPLEVDMHIWYAQALKVKKDYSAAYEAYDKIIELMSSGKGKKGVNNKEKLPRLETLLLTRVELAEKRGQGPWLDKAYRSYVEQSTEKTRWVGVHYQLAYALYKESQYEKAAQALREVATMKEDQSPKLKKKAADLALDALALLKDDQRLEDWSRQFAALFPKGAKEYQSISRKSLFNQVAKQAKEDLEASWATLAKINPGQGNSKERLDYYRNKLVLAEKLKKFPQARQAADELLSLKNLSRSDRQFALSRKAWLAEMFFDFKTAFKVTKELRLDELSAEQKTLKLALFSELAGQNAFPYYRRYLKQVIKDEKKAQAVALKLVEKSPRPFQELMKHQKILGRNTNQFATLYLNEIAKIGGKTFKKHSAQILKNKKWAATPAGQFLWRQRFISQYEAAKKKIEGHKIVHKTQRRLSRSLKTRIARLGKLDVLLKQAIKKQDWTAQVITLKLLFDQTSRFHQDIISLPMPEGLTSDEQTEYLGLLSQQASPYQVRADELKKKLDEFWKSDKLLENWREQYISSHPAVRKMMSREIKLLASLSPENFQEPLLEILAYRDPLKELPDRNEVDSLRAKVGDDPLNLNLLTELLDLEKQFGETTMVSYLESRVERLRTMSSNKGEE